MLTPYGDICAVSNEQAAMQIFGRPYTIRQCSALSTCTASMHHADPATGITVDVIYCEADMKKCGILLLAVLAVLFVLNLLRKRAMAGPTEHASAQRHRR